MSSVRSTSGDVDVDLGRLFSSLLRNWLRIVVMAVVVAGLAFALASLATPYYRAETRVTIERTESPTTRQPDTNSDSRLFDEEGINTQIEIFTSTDLLKEVARKLNLADNPEFDDTNSPSLLKRMLIMAGLKSNPADIPAEERVLTKFRENLKVYRSEKTRTIVIEFSSESPQLAAEVPQVIAKTYMDFSLAAKQQANNAAIRWLEPEIKALTSRVKAAESNVADFRSQSDLMVGQNNSALATQQLSELSTELTRTRANRASAEADAESVRLALKNGGSLDAFPSVISSNLIQRLRERQVQLQADIADLSTTLLGNHPRMRALKSQLADLDRQIATEARKILRGLSNASQAAKLREAELVGDLNRLKAESARVGEKEVELRSLEREAAAEREQLESYLSRYREAQSRGAHNYLPVDALTVSDSVVPLEPYFPKVWPITGAALAAAMLLMSIGILLRELFSGRAMRPAHGAYLEPVEQVQMPVFEPTAERKSSPRSIVHGPGQEENYGGVSARAAAEMLIAGGAKRALFVSPEGDEAAASAVMVARDVADSGLRVLLVDLTAMGAVSTPMLDGANVPGITDLLAGTAKFTEVIHADQYSDCHVIPVGNADQRMAMRAVERLPIIMNTLNAAYDVVIVECGPAGADSIRRLVSEGTEVLVSILEPDDAVLAARDDLASSGYEGLTLVTPADYAPYPDRTAA